MVHDGKLLRSLGALFGSGLLGGGLGLSLNLSLGSSGLLGSGGLLLGSGLGLRSGWMRRVLPPWIYRDRARKNWRGKPQN